MPAGYTVKFCFPVQKLAIVFGLKLLYPYIVYMMKSDSYLKKYNSIPWASKMFLAKMFYIFHI